MRVTPETYPYVLRPFDHQRAALDDSWGLEQFAHFLDPGLGKTKITIDTCGILHANDKLHNVLIFAPNSVVGPWVEAIEKHWPAKQLGEPHVFRWKGLTTKTNQREYEEIVAPTDLAQFRFFLMNVESQSSQKGRACAEEFLKRVPGRKMIVVDESSLIKSPKAARSKAIVGLGKLAEYRRILTGTPVPNSPMDVFAPFCFLSGSGRMQAGQLGFRTYLAFRSYYAIERQRVLGPRSFKEIVGYQRLDDLNRRMDPYTLRLTKDECLDLPDKTYVKHEAVLTPDQAKLYADVSKNLLAEIDGGLIDTSVALTKLLRLQQIIAGHVTSGSPPDEEVHTLDSNRVSVLMEIIAGLANTEKVVIWSDWRLSLEEIASALRKEYGADSTATFHGGTSNADRDDIRARFQDPKDPLRFFVGNPATAGMGLTLHAASNMIFFTRSFRMEQRVQAEERIHRIGQHRPCTYFDIVTPGSVDEHILRALREKRKLSAKVLGDMLRGEWI